MSKHIVVIGNGMVGHRLVERLRADGGDRVRITVLGEEVRPAYDRVQLSSYFSGRSAEDLSLVADGFYDGDGVVLHLNTRVVEIDREGHAVVTAAGERIDYDRLVLATGSYPFVPPVEGADRPDCFVYRTIEDLEAMTEAGAAWWLGGFLVLLFACWTLVTVPYEALGPELTFRYDERTAVLAWRDGLLLAGTVAAVLTPPLLAAAFGMGDDTDGERRKFAAFAVVYAPLIVASCWVCAWLVRERAPSSTATPSAGYGHVLGNRPFRILLASYTVAAIGGSLPATLLPYYVTYVIGADVEGFLLIYFVVGIACLPGWVWLSRRADKKTVWLAAMAANTGAFIGVYFLGPGDVVAYGTLVSLSGVGFGATIALPSAMQADVIDYGELLTGRRSEGQYLGVWSISRKLAAAAGVGAALPILEWAGYVPGVEQSDAVRHVLSALYALVPRVCNAAGFAIAIAYPITRERHAAIRAAIATRAEGRAVVDPLRKEVTLAPRQQP